MHTLGLVDVVAYDRATDVPGAGHARCELALLPLERAAADAVHVVGVHVEAHELVQVSTQQDVAVLGQFARLRTNSLSNSLRVLGSTFRMPDEPVSSVDDGSAFADAEEVPVDAELSHTRGNNGTAAAADSARIIPIMISVDGEVDHRRSLPNDPEEPGKL